MGRHKKDQSDNSEELSSNEETSKSSSAKKPLNGPEMKSMLAKVLNSKFSSTVVFELGKQSPSDVSGWISTGCDAFDYICSNRKDGGVPVGRITDIIGQESSGKSLVCQHIAVNAQKKGYHVVYIDTETALDAKFAKRLGLNLEDLIYAIPQTLEDAFEVIEESIKKIRAIDSETPIIIIFDSVAGTACKREVEGTFDPQELIGMAARIISKAMRKLTEQISKEKITMIFTNQLKTTIGKFGYGDPMSATYGGKAIPFHASLRIKVVKLGELKLGEDTVGIKCQAKVIKSKVAPPFRSCKFPTLFSYGIDNVSSVMDTLKDFGVIKQAGAVASLKINGEEVKFNKSSFREKFKTDEAFKNYCLSALEEKMVIKYDDTDDVKLAHVDVDPESLLEVQSVAEALDEVEESEG